MRRVLTAFLIVSLLGGQVGMLGALLGRHHARQHMDRQIEAASGAEGERDAIQHLTLSRSDRQSPNAPFVRIDEREFRYRGHLYDIVHAEWQGSVWHVWALHDRQEETYLDALAQAVTPPMLEDPSVPAYQRPVAYRPVALVPAAALLLPSPRVRLQSFPPLSFAGHQAPYLEVSHPPPWG